MNAIIKLHHMYKVELSNSGKKCFDSILATESIFAIQFDSAI